MATLKRLVATNILRLLGEKGLSQADLAKSLKVTFQTVNGIVNERAGISGKMITQLAAFFEVEESDIVAASASVHTIAREAARETVAALRERPTLQAAGPQDELAARIAQLSPAALERLEIALKIIEKNDQVESEEKSHG